jgi:hypothetical protein
MEKKNQPSIVGPMIVKMVEEDFRRKTWLTSKLWVSTGSLLI